MPNNISLFKKYIDLLDEVYMNASVTSILDSDSTLARQGANANEIIIPKISMDGLGDYSRSDGFANGDVTLTNETVTFNYDRGRAFSVDNMDNEETAGIAFGKLASEFLRTKVVPELDAFRFATYAAVEGIGSNTGTFTDGADVLAELRAATAKMDEAEVPLEGRYLFITPTLHGMISDLDTYKSKEVLSRFTTVRDVPQTRFYTAIDLKNGRDSGEETGGYSKSAGGADINFMVLTKDAIMQYTKHMVSKVVSPDQNQNADAWKFMFRSYGLSDVYENKVSGLYLCSKGA